VGDTSKSYTYCKIEEFTQKEAYSMKQQLELFDKQSEGTPERRYKLLESNFLTLESGSVSSYDFKHDLKINKSGHVFGQNFSYYIEPNEFFVYTMSNLNLALVNVKKDVVIDLINVSRSYDDYGIRLVNIEIPIAEIIKKIGIINGAWFSDINEPNLKSAGLFGTNVDQSTQFLDTSKIGDLSAINFIYLYKGIDLKLQLTKFGSLVFQARIMDEKTKKPNVYDEIKFLIYFYNKYIKPIL